MSDPVKIEQAILNLGKPEEKREVKVDRIEWFDDRFYRIEEGKSVEFYESVTSFLGIINKPFLSRWRGDIGNDEADRRSNYAKWRGSRIHETINILLNEGEFSNARQENGRHKLEQDEWIQVLRFIDWVNIFSPQFLGTEVIVFSREYKTAGTLDFPCMIEKGEYKTGKTTKVEIPESGLYIGDLKTGKGVEDSHHLQTSHYADQYNVMKLGKPVGTFILHTNTDSQAGWKMHVRTREEMNQDFQDSLHALKLYRRLNPNKTPKVFDMPITVKLPGYPTQH